MGRELSIESPIRQRGAGSCIASTSVAFDKAGEKRIGWFRAADEASSQLGQFSTSSMPSPILLFVEPMPAR